MAPKKRDPNNSDLTGTNIKVSVKGGKAYYYYLMPESWRQHPSFNGKMEVPLAHGDRQTSIEAALELNRQLRPSGGLVERIVNAPPRPASKNPLFIEVINHFEVDWLEKKNYSKQVLQARKQKLELYRKRWPHDLIGDIDTFTIAQLLRELTPEAARQHRNVLDPLFRFAASEGFQTLRPMLDIEKRKAEKPKRARHTWEGHLAIYNAAPEWLQRAINIALYSLQRRADLVAINIRDQINIEQRTISILQQKTRTYENPVYIEICMGQRLYDVVMAAIRSPIACPFLIHYQPLTRRRAALNAKPHPFAVLEDYLTKEYAKVRDAVGVYNHLPAKQRPGIHSLRALGVWLYYKAGFPEEYIMALAGHADKKMTQRYEDGHEKPKPIKVSAGLELTDGILTDLLTNIDWQTTLSKPLRAIVDSSD